MCVKISVVQYLGVSCPLDFSICLWIGVMKEVKIGMWRMEERHSEERRERRLPSLLHAVDMVLSDE